MLRRFSTPIGAAVALVEIASGQSVGRVAARVTFGLAGAAAGGVLCSAETVATRGVGAPACLVLVPLGGAAGDWLGRMVYDYGPR